MPRRNALKGVLANFLDTYISRYSEYQGYWLFGFVVGKVDSLSVDLLRDHEASELPVGFAKRLARIKFSEQLAKAGFSTSVVERAQLEIEAVRSAVPQLAGGHTRPGFDVYFRASLVTDRGRPFSCERVAFVSPHSSIFEGRSTRPTADRHSALRASSRRLKPGVRRWRTGDLMIHGRLAWLVGVALLVLVVNVAVSILYMVVYGHLIDPGHEEQYYRDHIKVAAPYCSIVAGIPLMFLAGWWVGGWWEKEFAVKAGLVVWLAYALIDIGMLMAAGLTPRIAVLFAVSFLTKLAAVCLGALVAGRHA